MKIIWGILVIPFRMVVSTALFAGFFIASLFLSIAMLFKYRSFYPFKDFYKSNVEYLIDALGFPFWPLMKAIKN